MRMVTVWSDTKFGDLLIMLTATHFDIRSDNKDYY